MRLISFLSCLLVQSLAVNVVSGKQWPLHDDGLNKVVEWDHYSFKINGERLFIWSGEMHYWRAPVPEMWIDILQKVKAAGFNTISFYGNWGYHNAKDGSLDFENGAHNFERLFEIAKEVGLYVLFRPGPYVNAEATAGGFPGWVTTGAYGELRNNDTRYTDAWTPYMDRMSQIIAKHQVTNGGNVFIYQIENEFGNQWLDRVKKIPDLVAIDYMELMEASARRNGIDVPLIHNNPNMNTKSWSKDYSNEGGNVDIYSADHYPSCWSCDLTECTGTNGNVPDFTTFEYYTSFQDVAPTQPSFLAEFQGGSYLPWGGPEGGCVNNTGPDWVNVFYRHNVAQKITAVNVYMAFGGTTGIPFPGVGTSYDYSAPISETRFVGDKYSETKLFAQFLRVARDLTKVDRVNNGTTYASNSAIMTTELRNPDTNAAFYVTAHAFSPSTDRSPFKLDVSTSAGRLAIPQNGGNIVLNGRESKIIVTDFSVGREKLIYSTAEVLTVSIQDGKPIVFLWLPAGESGEFLLDCVRIPLVLKKDGCSNIKFKQGRKGFVTSYTQSKGSCVLQFETGIRFVLLDRSAAYDTWVPSLSNNPFTYENTTVVVQGPYLVRNVAIEKKTIDISGDWSEKTDLEVFAPKAVNSITFNGKKIQIRKTLYGSLIGTLKASTHSVDSIKSSLPALTSWKVNDGLPERKAAYDDSKWTDADHKTTQNPTAPATYPVLYSDEYGFHHGNLLWRGRFSGAATGVYLDVIGGAFSGWSAYLNDKYIGSWVGNKDSNGALELSFANATLNTDSENVLFVIQDHMGKDLRGGATIARGIYNATLVGGGKFSSWKLTGTAGGEDNIDPVRGVYAEGGLHAERLGWHLPGFNDAGWKKGTPDTGLSTDGASFYRTVVPLDIPKGIDVSLGLKLSSPTGLHLRAQIYVNGYMFGKYIPHIGNQITFPVFPGILDYHGDNTIAVSLWAQDAAGASLTVDWTVLGVVESAFDPGFEADYLRPGWTDNRSDYY
ncbi:hypothetical protein VE04_01746 [Pseudogymnoascus sp. 24MN13]|nr:hypothetical protein VE04_01746 [Pseudogymnoascus sp. 24MN13]